jgi:hypothetical protein
VPIFSHCHGAAEAAAAKYARPYRPLSEHQPLLRENPSLPITGARRRGFQNPSRGMRVVRRVGELKPIDGRLDVVPPEAAARLRTRIGVGKRLPRGDADDSAHDRDREGPILDRRQIRPMGHARTISAPPQRTTRARSLEA